jgi:hypothetical protein
VESQDGKEWRRIFTRDVLPRHRVSRLLNLPLNPAGRFVVSLLFGVGDPCLSIRVAPPVDRSCKDTCLGDVEVAAIRRLMTQRHIGLAPREVCRLPRLDKLQSDAGRQDWVTSVTLV